MNWSETDKLGGGGGGGRLPTDEPLLLSVRILLLETEADKFPAGISDTARKLCITGWTGALGAAERTSPVIRWAFAAINSEVFSKRNWTLFQNASQLMAKL